MASEDNTITIHYHHILTTFILSLSLLFRLHSSDTLLYGIFYLLRALVSLVHDTAPQFFDLLFCLI